MEFAIECLKAGLFLFARPFLVLPQKEKGLHVHAVFEALDRKLHHIFPVVASVVVVEARDRRRK
jgi:hypothetical protein